jgi:hypothetical protein
MLKLTTDEIPQALEYIEELDALKEQWKEASRAETAALRAYNQREREIGAAASPAKPGQVIEWFVTLRKGQTRRNRMIIGWITPTFATEVRRDKDLNVIMDENGNFERFAVVYFTYYGLRIKSDDGLGDHLRLETRHDDVSEISVYRPDEDPSSWIKPDSRDPVRKTTQEQIDRWLRRE